MGEACARAHANVAIVKYWGKRDEARHLPCTDSVSVTLDGLYAQTHVHFADEGPDTLHINDVEHAAEPLRLLLDHVRLRAGMSLRAQVRAQTNIALAAGLASSAAGFAALAASAARAAGLELSKRELSVLARLGSGSACRSIYGGYVLWQKGARDDGADSHALPLFEPNHWDLGFAIAIVDGRMKPVSSREAMRLSRTSRAYRYWLASIEGDVARARSAIAARDLEALGAVAEASATKMHLLCAATEPPVHYWQESTFGIVDAVVRWREELGLQAYFTVDAGPNVAVLCPAAELPTLCAKLQALPGVNEVLRARVGEGVHYVEPACS